MSKIWPLDYVYEFKERNTAMLCSFCPTVAVIRWDSNDDRGILHSCQHHIWLLNARGPSLWQDRS